MAESFDIVAIVAGGLTALGVVLDWGVTPETKQRLQTKLEGLLYRFRYTTLRTFGRDEIEFSMRVIEVFGRRFLSWHRVFAVVVTYALITFAVLGVLLLTTDHAVPETDGGTRVALGLSAIIFSLSISFSFWMCRVLGRVPGGATLLGTCVLLLVHLALLITWRPFVETLLFVLPDVFYLMRHPFDFSLIRLPPFDYLWKEIVGGAVYSIAILLDPRESWYGWLRQMYLHKFYGWNPQYGTLWMGIDGIAALIANGLRIGLALLFLSGFVFVQAIRPSLIWFWSALTRSPALFSPPLSALAAIILAVDNREAIIGALTQPFQ